MHKANEFALGAQSSTVLEVHTQSRQYIELSLWLVAVGVAAASSSSSV